MKNSMKNLASKVVKNIETIKGGGNGDTVKILILKEHGVGTASSSSNGN